MDQDRTSEPTTTHVRHHQMAKRVSGVARLALLTVLAAVVFSQGALTSIAGAASPDDDLNAQKAQAAFVLGLTHTNLETAEFALSAWGSQVLTRLGEIHLLRGEQAALEAKAANAHDQAVLSAVDQYVSTPLTPSVIRYGLSKSSIRPLVVNEYTDIATQALEAQRGWEDALAASYSAQAKKINALISREQFQGLLVVNEAVTAEQSYDAARAQADALAATPSSATPAPTIPTTPLTVAPSTTTTTTTVPSSTTTTIPGHHTNPTSPSTTTTTTVPTAAPVVPAAPPETSFAPDNPVVLPTATPDLQGLSIQGPEMLSAAQIAGWYRSVGHRNITGKSPLELAQLYLDEGRAEDVRGDIAFAQAMIETAGFSITSGTDNFAGIGACDSCERGYSFPSVQLGVRAQIELLKAYADPFYTEATTARPPAYKGIDTLSVRGKEPTWDSLSGVWSSGTTYGQDVLALYQSMVKFALAHPNG